jgi:hypothetical protein
LKRYARAPRWTTPLRRRVHTPRRDKPQQIFSEYVSALNRRDKYRQQLDDVDHPLDDDRREQVEVRLDRVEHQIAELVRRLDAYERKNLDLFGDGAA